MQIQILIDGKQIAMPVQAYRDLPTVVVLAVFRAYRDRGFPIMLCYKRTAVDLCLSARTCADIVHSYTTREQRAATAAYD